MVRVLRVALDQMNPTVGAVRCNADRIIEGIKRAREANADVVAFPELAVTGYPPEDLVLKPAFIAENMHQLQRIARDVGDLTAIVGYVDTDGQDIYNAAAIIQQGRVVGVHRKIFLPNYSVFDEQRYFKAGSAWNVYTIRGVKVGVTICEDIWYPIGPATMQAMAGAEVIVNINGSPFRCGKHTQRYRMIATRALDELSYVCYLNMIGGQDELVFEGASFICDQDGDRVVQGKWFEEDFLVADLDIEAVFSARLHDTRRRQGALLPDTDWEGRVIETPLAETVERAFQPLPDHCYETLSGSAEMYGALVLGTRDYVRKTGADKVVVALSGGIDSSLVAAIAVDALGAENVSGVSMPSRYSSSGSRTDAEELAHNLGIRCLSLPIEEVFSAYLTTLQPAFAGKEPDVTEENLQARIRGNLVMAMTNKFGGIVLTTGNKSEMAVGYSTLYGDLAGGFAVIKDVFKTNVYRLAEWRNQQAGHDMIPRSVLEKPPSAELRPGQLDEQSLPPYDILDGILRMYVEEDRSMDDIVAHGHDPAVVARVINLVDRSEYKRRQAPPGIKISALAFGKDRRLPIVNGYKAT